MAYLLKGNDNGSLLDQGTEITMIQANVQFKFDYEPACRTCSVLPAVKPGLTL